MKRRREGGKTETGYFAMFTEDKRTPGTERYAENEGRRTHARRGWDALLEGAKLTSADAQSPFWGGSKARTWTVSRFAGGDLFAKSLGTEYFFRWHKERGVFGEGSGGGHPFDLQFSFALCSCMSDDLLVSKNI